MVKCPNILSHIMFTFLNISQSIALLLWIIATK